MHSDEEPREQGDVLWQNPVRFAPEVEPRVARIVRHKVTYTAGFDGRVSGGREDEIHVETFSRDARGRSRWCDATTFEAVAILKAALASAHMVLDAHREDEKRRRDAMIEALQRRRSVEPTDARDGDPRLDAPVPLPEPESPLPTPRCGRVVDERGQPNGWPCGLPSGHAGKCDPDIPF